MTPCCLYIYFADPPLAFALCVLVPLTNYSTNTPSALTTLQILLLLLDPDMCGYLCCVAKTNPFRPSELVYRTLCESIYGSQVGVFPVLLSSLSLFLVYFFVLFCYFIFSF